MIIGVPKEIKNREFRVGATPGGVAELVSDGHTVMLESGAGNGSGFADENYSAAGAVISAKEDLFGKAEMIVKIKEPLPEEFQYFRQGQILFTYLHLAPNPDLVKFLQEAGITALAYETLQVNGRHPLLEPMSEVAGRMAPLVGAFYLQKGEGGNGRLPAGAPGTFPGKATIIGAGLVGKNAARICHGLGMDVTMINRGAVALRAMDDLFGGKIKTLSLTSENVIKSIAHADMVVGAIYKHGSRTPVLVTEEMVKTKMKKGAVIVDVSVDQGGCVETIQATTHENPVYTKHGVIHYGVANMPGAFPATSTVALTNVTLPFIRKIAAASVNEFTTDPILLTSVNIMEGKIILDELKRSG